MLTPDGVAKTEHLLGVTNLYDNANTEINHYVQQALKAEFLFKRDRDYVVKDGQVVIVDEFTGRLMDGRRYSDGLHQAIEAKENVIVKNESQNAGQHYPAKLLPYVPEDCRHDRYGYDRGR